MQHNPDDIMTDFDIASINAAAAKFPGIEMKGCSITFWQISGKEFDKLGCRKDIQIRKILPTLYV